MKDPTQEYIESYREVFEKDAQRRRKAAEVNEEVANLGADVIERGTRKLLKKHEVDIEELEKSNEQLSQKLSERIHQIDEELSHLPEDYENNRRRLMLLTQQAGCAQSKDPCAWPPPMAIFNDIPRPCHDGCRVEVSNDPALGRVYPVLNMRGTGWSRMRTGEVYCEYIWAFDTTSTGRYLINPQLEFHGRVVQTREHHCYADTSGTGWEYRLTMGHAQPPDIPSPIFTDMEGTLPHVAGSFRYDGFRVPNYMPILSGTHRTYIHVGLHLRVSARSQYATVQVNFGDPSSENFIGMPWLCWLPPGEWP
jgi:hypothetical protein